MPGLGMLLGDLLPQFLNIPRHLCHLLLNVMHGPLELLVAFVLMFVLRLFLVFFATRAYCELFS